ncbi:MAG TPA: hypothetical protein VI583_02815 [Cyclobacteriaceae bacterium]|nr:hypothetical protein [Cyclobacteriaceae bacterium]
MNNIIFWRNWNKADRIPAAVFFIFLILAALYLIYGYFYGLSNIIGWEINNDLVPVDFDNLFYETGSLKIGIPIDQFLIFQYYEGSTLNINPVFWNIYLAFFVIAFNLILAVLSGIPRFWFYGTMGAFIGFIVLMQPDHIMLFGSNDKSASILILSIYLSIGYIFREFKPGYSMAARFLIFLSASVIMGVIIYIFAGVPNPFSYLMSYGIAAPILVSVLFIITVSHEIIFAFLLIVSGASMEGRRNSVLHFTLMSVIYLAYVFITFLFNTNRISWNLVYLNPLVILCICVFGGIWWLKHRENLYKEIFYYQPSAALIFLGFGILTLSTYGFILSVGNDPIAEAFEDTIIYGQLGFGIMFYIYVIANFANLMFKGYNVIPVVYRSKTIPFFVLRVGGLVITGFLLFQSGFFPFFQAKAGYYNLIGDLFWEEDKAGLAEQYYIKGSEFEYQNHRSNYALASVSRMKGNKAEEIYYLENANLKKPSPYAYINISNIFLSNGQYFDGLFKLSEGYKKFPESSRVNNNLGYFYSKTDIYDSAYYFFNQAKNINPRLPEVRSNGYALISRAKVSIDFDSIVSELGDPVTIAGRANIIALANDYGISLDYDPILPVPDSMIRPEEFAYLYNSCLDKIEEGDTSLFSHILTIADKLDNTYYDNQLRIISALGFYHNHQVRKAFMILDDAASASFFNGKFDIVAARLYLASGAPRSAVVQFEKVTPLHDPYDRLYYGISLLASGKLDSSATILRNLLGSPDQDIRNAAGEYLKLYFPQTPEDTIGDEFKYNQFHYGLKKYSDASFDGFLQSIQSPAIRDLARLEKASALIGSGKYDEAGGLMAKLENPHPESGLLKSFKNMVETIFWIRKYGNTAEATSMDFINAPVNDPDFLPNMLKNACIAASRKDTLAADNYYEILAGWDPFFEEGILGAFEYFKEREKGGLKAYSILYDALELNPYSIPLNREFVFQCIRLNLLDYARNSISLLRESMDAGEFAVFEQELSLRTKANLDAYNRWGQ